MRTNGGKPHVCNTLQVHNGPKEGVTLCEECDMPLDTPHSQEEIMKRFESMLSLVEVQTGESERDNLRQAFEEVVALAKSEERKRCREIAESKRCDEKKICYYGGRLNYAAESYDEKALVNAVVDDIIRSLE